jgi:hypothetical protein
MVRSIPLPPNDPPAGQPRPSRTFFKPGHPCRAFAFLEGQMADYLTLFAAELDVRVPANLARARQFYEESPAASDSETTFRDGFDLNIDERPGLSRLRIFASQSGDTGAVIRFVRHCAREFGLTGPWGFEWAHVSTKPMLHSFGGGALVLDLTTGDTLAWTDTHGWLVRQLAKAGRTS